jgi:hypothetical protein
MLSLALVAECPLQNIISRGQVKDYLVSMRGLIINRITLTGSLINKIMFEPPARYTIQRAHGKWYKAGL